MCCVDYCMIWDGIIAWCGVRLLDNMRVRLRSGMRLLHDVRWDYCMMLGEIIGGGMICDLQVRLLDICGVRILHDVDWDYCMMWGEITGWCDVSEIMMMGEIMTWCGVRLLHDVGCEITGCDDDGWWDIGWCGVRLLHDVVWDYCMMWGEITEHDVAWDYWMMWG